MQQTVHEGEGANPIPPLTELVEYSTDLDIPPSSSRVREVYRGRDFSVRYFFCGCGPDDAPFEEIHQETCLGIVLSGFFSYKTDCSTCAMSPGAVLLGNKGHAYQCGHEHSHGDVSLVFAIEESMLAAVLDWRGLSSSRGEFHLPYLSAMPDLSVTIGRAEAAASAGDGFWLEEIAYTLLASAISSADGDAREQPEPSSRDMGRASDVIQFIEENYASQLTLSRLADIAGVSPFHFLRLFRTVTGTTPYRYLVQLRLREAAARILQTDNPITDIAFEVGFGDLSQFIRTFRGVSGFSPSRFRSTYS